MKHTTLFWIINPSCGVKSEKVEKGGSIEDERVKF